MNRQNHQELIVSGIHLELTPSLKMFVQEKAERLFRHEERILRMRVELECDSKEGYGARFKAKGHVTINGPAMNATVESDECHKAVSLLTDKLDRMLSPPGAADPGEAPPPPRGRVRGAAAKGDLDRAGS